MKPGKRFGLSGEQKSDVWRRWKEGQTLHEIGRAFGKEHSSIRCLVSRHGGIAPAVRRRALLALTLREREEISRGLASGSSIREIAKCLERAVSTVSREVAGPGGRPAYRTGRILVSFMEYDLGYIDLEEKTLQPLDNPFGPKSVTYVSGTICHLCLRAGPKTGWRRGWDSNPRDPFGPNGFQDRRFQPLTHPSGQL
jgi:hypothetical protein